MKDYSTQHDKYGIIEHGTQFAIVEVTERDGGEVITLKPETLSISKYLSTLQQQLNGWYDRESTPLVSGLEQWKEAKGKQRRTRERVTAK